jgi:hypothetical protein
LLAAVPLQFCCGKADFELSQGPVRPISWSAILAATGSADFGPAWCSAWWCGLSSNWTGFWLINWLRRTNTLVHSAYRELVALVADGTLNARVDRTVRLEDRKEALSRSQGVFDFRIFVGF